MKIIRTSSLSLKYLTAKKKRTLDIIMNEYCRVVNLFIHYYWQQQDIPKYSRTKLDTWLSARLQGKAEKQAKQIVKSIIKKDREIRYRRYKRVYKYFLSKNTQIKFTSKKFSELNLTRKLKPNFTKQVMEIDGDIINVICVENTCFDIWFKMTSIGNKFKVTIPCKLHKHFKRYKNWKMMSGCRIRRHNNNYYLDVFFEKDIDKVSGSNVVGIDLGINTLITTSQDIQYGKEFKTLLFKLDKKKQKSKNAERLRNQIKNYINYQVKQLPITDVYVLEQLKYIQIGTKSRVNKTTRKLLSRWNLGTIHKAIENKCEINGINLVYINPKYTSRTCPHCGNVDKKNRQGEIFRCIKCGYEDNADINASHNILSRFYEESNITCDTVPHSQKSNV